MAKQNAKKTETAHVRIYKDSKEWLEEKVYDRTAKEHRKVTTAEIAEEIFERARKRERKVKATA